MSGGFCSSPSPVKHASNRTTDGAGLWTGTVLAGLRYMIQPMTAGEFTNSLSLSGTTATVQFRKFKSGGLGITLGTLLDVQAFEATSGVVNFNLIGCEDI